MPTSLGGPSSIHSGQDTQLITGNQTRLHTGQAIGILAGAVSPGDKQTGLQLIAAQGPIDLQAQSDQLSIQAKDQINILSSHGHIDWASAKSISLSTAGGANITIEGGNITVQCPGTITVKAGKKSFMGAAKMDYIMPVLPSADNSWVKVDSYYEGWNVPRPLEGLKIKVNGETVGKSLSVKLEKKENT